MQLTKLTRFGFQYASSKTQKREYFFSNLICITLITSFGTSMLASFIKLWYTNWDLLYYETSFISVQGFIVCTAITNLFLNGKGYYQQSRILLVLVIPFTLFFFSLLIEPGVGPETYLWYPYLPIAFMVMIHFLFINEKDEWKLVFIAGLYLLVTIFAQEILRYFSYDERTLSFYEVIAIHPVAFRIVPIILYLFIFTTILFVVKSARRHEQELYYAKKEIEDYNQQLIELNASKDKFHSIIAHDLRGPFNSILGLTKIMSNSFESLSQMELKKYVEMLYDSCKNTGKLLENLLEWSMVHTGSISFEPKPCIIQDLVNEVLNNLSGMAKEKEVVLINNCKYSIEMLVDSNMIRAVIRNLVSNSIKFTPEKGEIKISCIEKGDVMSILVEDTGVGMSAELKDKLFKVEEKVTQLGTNDEKGTGLGLMLVKEFVERHNGSLNVESELGVGSKFIIELPLNC